MDPFESIRISTKDILEKCQTADSQYRSLKDRYEKLEISSSKTSEEFKTLGLSLTTVNEKNNAIRNELAISNQRNEELKKQFTNLNKQNEELLKQLANFKKRNEELQRELTDSGSSLNVALNKNAELEILLNEAKVEVKDIKNKLKLVSDEKSKLQVKLRQELNKNKNWKKKFSNIWGTVKETASECLEKSDEEDIPTCLPTDQLCTVEIAPTGDKGINRSSPVSAVSVQSKPNPANTVVSPTKNNVDTRRSPVSTILVTSNNVSKFAPVTKDDIVIGHRSSSPVGSPPNKSDLLRSTRSQNSDNRTDRRSPVSSNSVTSGASTESVISPEKDLVSSIDVTSDHLSKSKETNLHGVQSNQAATSVSPAIGNHNLRRSLTSSIASTSKNQSTVKSASFDESNRLTSTSIAGQATASVIPTADNHTSRRSLVFPTTATLKNQSSAKPVSTDETSRPAPTLIIDDNQNNQGIASALPSPNNRNLRSSPVSPILATSTSKNQSTAKSVSADAPDKGTSRPTPTTIPNVQSNQAITSVLSATDKHNLRSGPVSSISTISKTTSTTKPVSTGAEEASRHRPTAISGAQHNETVTATTPSKYPSPGSPFSFPRTTPSKAVTNSPSLGDKGQDVHLSRSSLLVSRAQENQREFNDASKGDSFTADSPIPPATCEKDAPTLSNTDSTKMTSRPEDMMPLLFPDLRNTPRSSFSSSDESNLQNVTILEDSDGSPKNSSPRAVSKIRSSTGTKSVSDINKFPVVSLSRVEIPDTSKQIPAFHETSRKNRKASQEDLGGPSKRQKSHSEQKSLRCEFHADGTSTSGILSPNMRSLRVSRVIKHKVTMFQEIETKQGVGICDE